jgi:diacylglycerol kinase (ATP)
VMPCGTGGDLGRVLGTRNLDSALQALMQGTTAQIDVGLMQYLNAQTDHLDARYFINVADTGIGAATAQRVNASSMRFGGLVSYLGAAVQTIAGFKPWNAVVEVDGHEIFAGPVGMVVFANSRYFAGGMLVAPDASLCDGLLDIFVLEGIGKRPMLTSLLPRVYQGKHVGRPGVTHVTGATASVRSSDGMLIEMDGELVGRTPVSASVVPRVLRVVGLAAILNNAGGCANAGP